MENNDKSGAISFGINLITFGIIALLVTLELTTWQYVLDFFLTYWPLFIVLAGVKLVLSAITKSSIPSVLLDFLIALGLLAAISAPAAKNFTSNIQNISVENTEEKSQTKVVEYQPQTENATYQLTLGASTFTLTDSLPGQAFKAASENGAMTVEDSYIPTTFVHSITFDNANAEITFRPPLSTLKRKYALETNMVTPAKYSLKVGASSGVVTLINAPISEYYLDLGAGSVEHTFTATATPKNVNINVGAGSCDIRIPKEVTIYLTYTVGAGNVSFNTESFGGLARQGSFTHQGTGTQSTNISVQVGAGEVSISTY